MENKSISPRVPGSGKRKPVGPSLPEKRNKGRVKLERSIRVRPSVPGTQAREEMILETLNVSRHGLYFVTASSAYHKNMRLFITYPYSSAPGAINRDYIAEITRIDRLPNDLYGIAIRFLTTLSLEMHT